MMLQMPAMPEYVGGGITGLLVFGLLQLTHYAVTQLVKRRNGGNPHGPANGLQVLSERIAEIRGQLEVLVERFGAQDTRLHTISERLVKLETIVDRRREIQ